MAKKIDFAAINHAAMGQFTCFLREWIPGGKLSGSEYQGLNPVRGDTHSGSFSVNTIKGVWSDFATGDSGSDPISLYAYLFTNNDQGEAAKALAEQLGIECKKPTRGPEAKAARQATQAGVPAASKPADESPWHPITPPVVCADPPKAHPVRGLPERVWTYRGLSGELLGFVYRFVNSSGGKEILPLTWCEHQTSKKQEWRWMQWAVPRPLYGLERLTVADVDDEHHKATVLIVEGEKCADAAAAQLPMLAVLTWSGGSKAVGKADWSVLAGRKVIIWPDCDAQTDKAGVIKPEDEQPGVMAAVKVAESLQAFGCKVWLVTIPKPGQKTSGWDVADAIDEGLTGEALEQFIRSHSVWFAGANNHNHSNENKPENSVLPPETACAGGGGSGDDSACSDQAGDDSDRAWFYALTKKARGGIEPCRSNVAKILRMHPQLRGAVGYNEFSHQVERIKSVPWSDTPGPWENADDSSFDEWLVDDVEVLIKSLATIAEGVSHAANANKFHPVRQFLEGLPAWDGQPRLDYFLAEITDNERTDFLRLAGRFFLIAMVARIYRPGVKFDYMLVLEGKQGQGKSSFFRILADPWFSETPFEIGTNEGNMAIQGVWLQEMAEMGMFSRSEDTAFKSFLAISKDKFRRPYDRRPVEVPRVCLFGGTTNLDQYLKDQTGNRRIWPVRCQEIDNQWLIDHREQLFAEAIVAFKSGERFYPTPEEERLYFEPEQRSRLSVDGWEELIAAFVSDPTEKLRNFYTALDLLINACKVEKSKIDEANRQTGRVGRIMSKLGWERVREPTGQYRRWGYVRPEQDRVRREIFGDPLLD